MTCKIIRCQWMAAIFLLVVSMACSGERSPMYIDRNVAPEDTPSDPFKSFKQVPAETYSGMRDSISRQKGRLWDSYNSSGNESVKNALLDSAGALFSRSIVYHLMPYWYGTPWTFEGHTDVPGQGEVACGYLVSTTLKHAGLNINRYKLAQQASSIGLKSLAFGEEVVIKRGLSREEIKNYFLKEKEEGLYKVGLAYHTGYLYFDKNELYFIHSSYLDPVAVTIERATEADAFNSTAYYILDITRNRGLMKKWLSGEEVPILK
jgi:hypothetical protein